MGSHKFSGYPFEVEDFFDYAVIAGAICGWVVSSFLWMLGVYLVGIFAYFFIDLIIRNPPIDVIESSGLELTEKTQQIAFLISLTTAGMAQWWCAIGGSRTCVLIFGLYSGLRWVTRNLIRHVFPMVIEDRYYGPYKVYILR